MLFLVNWLFSSEFSKIVEFWDTLMIKIIDLTFQLICVPEGDVGKLSVSIWDFLLIDNNSYANNSSLLCMLKLLMADNTLCDIPFQKHNF